MFLKKKFDFRFVMKGSCLVGFIQKKAKPHNRPGLYEVMCPFSHPSPHSKFTG